MKLHEMIVCLCLALFVQAPLGAAEPPSVFAYFTDAEFSDCIRGQKPSQGLAEAAGTVGRGVLLSRPMAVENPLLAQDCGMISFWIKPNWNGNDGKTHKLLRIGDPKNNGLLVEKAASGRLRYVMASPGKITVSRADVSRWKAGEWHHVAIDWMSIDGVRVGIPLWIDKVCVDGPASAGNTFLDPAAMTDRRVWIGDSSSGAVMDELVFRGGSFDAYIAKQNTPDKWSQIATVYRDYYRTAPVASISIDPDACQVPSDRRVVNGCPKLFGLQARINGRMERMTDSVVRYGNWADFDAKPFIKWSTTDKKIATVDADGQVMGKSVGRCKLIAEFHGIKASYDLQVIPIEQPDLDLYCVERLPRYSRKGEKWWPEKGEKVQSIAHVANFGFTPAPAGTKVRFELIPDKNGNFRLDPGEKAVLMREQVIRRPLAPREETTLKFSWTWPKTTMWVRVTVDPESKTSEICEANNQRCELNRARALQWGYRAKAMDEGYNRHSINLVGSFSYYDWFNGQMERLAAVMREAVYPSTSPFGIKDAIRSDWFYPLDPNGVGEAGSWKDSEYYDGGFPVGDDSIPSPLAINPGLVHEFGHTCLALPDLYGFPMRASNVLLKDEKGNYYAGTSMVPEIGEIGGWIFSQDKAITLSSALGVPCGVSYEPLMSYCHLWLDAACAGQVQFFAGYRGDKFWGVHGRLIAPFRQEFKVYDADDRPLPHAQVYVYHVSQAQPNAGAKYIADVPKFIGTTDDNGRFIFPTKTDESWDDPDTDEVDGAINVWNPFGRVKTDTAFTHNVGSLEGLLLIEIVSGDQTEFHWLPMTEFNRAFFEGQRLAAAFDIRTSLSPSAQTAAVVESKVSERRQRRKQAQQDKTTNLRPVATVAADITVKCGQEFTLDGSGSSDPEGQPLVYWWHRTGGTGTPTYLCGQVLKGKAPAEPGETTFMLTVCDGLRVSEPKTVKVTAAP